MTNILGNYYALEYAKKHKAKVLMTSTMEVYGEMQDDSKSETGFGLIDFNQVRSCYPESKRTAELLCRCYSEEYSVESVIARLGYIYGPTMSKTDNKVVAQFIRKIINKEDIVLKSAGTQSRSYCYVADVASGIFVVLFKGISGEAYNIASKKSETTIKDIAAIAAQIAGTSVVFDVPTELEKKGSSVSQDAVLNVEKLEALGWSDKYAIEEGLRRTVSILIE
jgi:nucleoside-diphosphate-sugar epimerase